MEDPVPLTRMEPRPMTPPTDPYPQQPTYHSTSVPNIHGHDAPNVGQIGLNPSTIPDHPSSMTDIPRPANGYGQMTSTLPAPNDVTQLKTQCQFNLREYQSLQRKRVSQGTASTTSMDLESRLRSQQGLTLAGLRLLQDEVKDLVKEAENHRWRRWLLGGAM